jgi:hypothetical protein
LCVWRDREHHHLGRFFPVHDSEREASYFCLSCRGRARRPTARKLKVQRALLRAEQFASRGDSCGFGHDICGVVELAFAALMSSDASPDLGIPGFFNACG